MLQEDQLDELPLQLFLQVIFLFHQLKGEHCTRQAVDTAHFHSVQKPEDSSLSTEYVGLFKLET